MVVHDYVGDDARLIDEHPLALAGRLRQLRIEPGTGRPSVQRNLGWRAARAELVAFIDDDCRADPGWLEALVIAAEQAPQSHPPGLHPSGSVRGGVAGQPARAVAMGHSSR